MKNKILEWLEYKRRITVTVANYYWKNYLEVDDIIKGKTDILMNVSLKDINQKFEEFMLDKTKEEILEWQNYKELAIYYSRLSKSKYKLFIIPKSKLERKLKEIKNEFYKKQK